MAKPWATSHVATVATGLGIEHRISGDVKEQLVSLLEEEGDHGRAQVAGPSGDQNGLYVLIIAGNNHVEKRMEKTSEMLSLRCEN